MKTKLFAKIVIGCVAFLGMYSASAQYRFSTHYFSIEVSKKGWITGMKNVAGKKQHEFSRMGKPSPLLSLYNTSLKTYYTPVAANYNSQKKQFTLRYSNGAMATVTIQPFAKYFKLRLEALSNRNGVDDIQWGPYHTAISNVFGEIIGVARDTSDAVNFAIGVLALDDNTIGGTSDLEGDAAPFQYIVHSADKKQYPLPANLREGQVFPIGGDGISDVAFYAHPEPYFRILYGNAAMIDSTGNISLAYHSRDRRKPRTISFSLIPFLATNKPNHIEVQPLPGVDFVGSSIALWGSADSTALLDVIQDIVRKENLPYPTINGKWVKDPAAFVPDAITSGGLYDSIISYTNRLGFKAISLYDQGFVRPDRGNEGYIDGKHFEKTPIKLSAGNKSHKEFSRMAAEYGIIIGRTPITNSLAPGTKDASPVPSDSLCYQQKRILTRSISADDTIIIVDNPTYLEEIGSWEGHATNLNMIKIGKELIHYLGVSAEPPYRLLNVKRGYWKTTPQNHKGGDTLYKLQVTINYGYDGVIPNMQLQDKIAVYYADVAAINGLGYYDFDGQEFLFNNGHGYYSAKRFFHKIFEHASKLNVPYIRFTGATLSEGSWHYQSIWNVGGGKNLYNPETRRWGHETSQGKDLRDVTFANFFPVGMGGNFPINAKSTPLEYEHIQAISVGLGTTYSLYLNQKDVESCPHKDAILKVIRTWENARAANAFPRWVKKELIKPELQFHLEETDADTWNLYNTNQDGSDPRLFIVVKRDPAYSRR